MKAAESDRFSKWIFHSFSVSAEGLALYRIFSALFVLAFLLPSFEIYRFLGSLPSEFYNPPPGLMRLFTGFPSEFIFYSLHIGLIVALVSVLIGFKTFYSSIASGLLFLIIKGFIYSVGKINHDILLVTVPIVMAFSGWGSVYSVDSYLRKGEKPKQDVQSWPFVLLALMIGFMMFTAGFPKILGGWLDPDTQATFGHFHREFFMKSRQDLFAQYAFGVENRFVWEFMDYATILFETGFLLAIFHPKTTRLFMSFAVIFHFSVMILLNIAFLPNFLAYAAFLDWSIIHKKCKEIFPRKFSPPILICSLYLIVLLLIFFAKKVGFPSLNSDLRIEEFYIVIISMPIALYFIISQSIRAVRV